VAETPLPVALRRELFRLDDPLLLDRHRAALAALGVRAPERAVLHVDAAGFSPELADALGDPFYLGAAALEGHAVVVCAEQLGARLVHPGLGFGAVAFRSVTRGAAREIGALTLREAILLDFRSDAASLADPGALADVSALEVCARTPGGLVEGIARLEECQREFLRSDRLWLDDAFLRDLAALAERVRDLPPLPEGFAASRHPLALFFCPAFGGSYVIEEPGASARAATTCVLAAELAPRDGTAAASGTSARGRRVELRRLDAASAVELLERHRIARLDLEALRPPDERLERALHWIAADALLAKQPDAQLPVAELREASRRLHEAGAPPEFRELEEVARRLRAPNATLDASALAPLQRLRLLSPASTRPAVRRFVRHLQAFLDPVDLGRAWRDAPDVFFARWVALSPERREHAARWLSEHETRPREEKEQDA
jgi:hypothetical protein